MALGRNYGFFGQARKIKEVLKMYESNTCQLVNPEKCLIMFGAACPQDAIDSVCGELQVQNVAGETKYLGLPTPEGWMKWGRFQSLRNRFGKRLNNWSERHISHAGKEVLIKSVAQALPTYIMGVFKLPLTLCYDFMQIIRNYWWGAENGRRKTHWQSWQKMVEPKSNGGLGFRDLRLFNQALLARHGWRLLLYPDSLCAKLLKAKYYPRGNLLPTVFGGNISQTWRSIMYGLENS